MLVNPEELQLPDTLTPIPQQIEIKEEFVKRYKELLGSRYDSFIAHSLSYARKAIRVNTLKTTPKELVSRLEKGWKLAPVPWCPEAFYISSDRFDVGNLIEHQLGYFYVQDPASMLPPIILDSQPEEAVLDLCAAPGSKTTQIAAMMQNTGVLIANDVSGARLKPLGMNLQRCGVRNTIVVMHANKKFKEQFDRVLVDAPCSATGTIRRSLKSLQMWSPGAIHAVAREQYRLMRQGWDALKPGGVMVYSTCTLEPEENEGNVSRFMEEHAAQLEEISLDIVRSESVTEWNDVKFNPEVKKCLRIYPQDNDTEGFFVAKFRKPGF